MSISLLDALIVVALIIGILGGWRKGVITEVAALVGTVAIVVISWSLKSQISVYFYKYLPFFKLGGELEGISSINILIYELIAFLVIASILGFFLGIILKITGLIETVLKATVLLSIPSRILGAIVGFFEAYLLVFVVLCILNQPFITFIDTNDSKFSDKIIVKTPLLSKAVNKMVNSGEEIYDLIKLKNKYTKEEMDYKTLEILLKDSVVKADSVDYLIKKGKITIVGAKALANKYR